MKLIIQSENDICRKGTGLSVRLCQVDILFFVLLQKNEINANNTRNFVSSTIILSSLPFEGELFYSSFIYDIY